MYNMSESISCIQKLSGGRRTFSRFYDFNTKEAVSSLACTCYKIKTVCLFTLIAPLKKSGRLSATHSLQTMGFLMRYCSPQQSTLELMNKSLLLLVTQFHSALKYVKRQMATHQAKGKKRKLQTFGTSVEMNLKTQKVHTGKRIGNFPSLTPLKRPLMQEKVEANYISKWSLKQVELEGYIDFTVALWQVMRPAMMHFQTSRWEI